MQTHLDVTQHMTDEAWHRMIGVHLNGTFFCSRSFGRRMIDAYAGLEKRYLD